MPQISRFIDQIARQKQRDVLYVHFSTKGFKRSELVTLNKERQAFITWLEQQGIEFYSCAEPINRRLPPGESDEWDLYIDVPFDLSNPQYQLLSGYLEDENGNDKIKGVNFYYFPLSKAMELAHLDEVYDSMIE